MSLFLVSDVRTKSKEPVEDPGSRFDRTDIQLQGVVQDAAEVSSLGNKNR